LESGLDQERVRRVQEKKGTTTDMHSERVILGLQACKEGRKGSGSERGWCPVTRFRQKGIRPLESERRGKANQKREERMNRFLKQITRVVKGNGGNGEL